MSIRKVREIKGIPSAGLPSKKLRSKVVSPQNLIVLSSDYCLRKN